MRFIVLKTPKFQLLRILLLGGLILLGASCSTLGTTTRPSTDADGFIPRVTFIHLNDTYRVDAVNNGRSGGFGRIATIVRRLKQSQDIPVVILHGGDLIFPSLESQIWNGIQMVEALNYLHDLAPVYLVPGNHEFEKRTDTEFANAVSASSFGWIAANMGMKTADPAVNEKPKPYELLTFGDYQVGIFGLTLHEDDGGENRSYAPIDPDYEARARESIEALNARGADAIIGLTHLEMYIDQDLSSLRQEYPNFILIAGGHEHTTQIQPLSDNQARILKGASNAREIWQMTLGLDASGRPALRDQFIEVDESISEDPGYRAAIETPYRRRLAERIPYVYERLAGTDSRFDATEETVRNQESTWGNFLTDQMLTAFDSDEPADVAVLNGGTIRIDDVFSEQIAFEHLLRTFFFSAQIRHVSMSGRDLVRFVLEHGLSASSSDNTLKPGDGRFLQVSGVRYCFDPDQPAGSRVTMAQIEQNDTWGPVDSTGVYRLAVTDFMYGGGDGYQIEAHSTDATPPGADLKYLAMNAMTNADWNGEIISAQIEGRIINETEQACPY